MMRRCILELSRRRSLQQVATPVRTQRPSFLLSRKEFSASSRQNVSQKPSGSVGKTQETGGKHSNMIKEYMVVGGVLISGAIAAVAYQNIYLNKPNAKEESTDFPVSDNVSKRTGGLGEQVNVNNQEPVIVNDEEPSVSNNNVVHAGKNEEVHSDSPQISDQSKVESESQVRNELNVTPDEEVVQQNELPSFLQGGISSDDQTTDSKTSVEDTVDKKEVGNSFANAQSSTGENEVVNAAPSSQETKVSSEEKEIKAPSAHHLTLQDTQEASLVNGAESPSSLTDLYHLGEKKENSNAISVDDSFRDSKEKEDSVGMAEKMNDDYIPKDGKLVLDFLEAIHAAEKRQAELDTHILAEEKRTLKEKYEKELKDARARELKYAEEAAILNKELSKEKITAAATVKSLQEKAEENLVRELERKDNEAEMHLMKVKELALAELAAAIAREKASQIEKMAEANIHIDALCLAFYARSEEARQSHSVHKLALGALALEDALSKGLPIQPEISALHTYLDGIDKDSLLNLVLSSLPQETLDHGTETQLQLNQKFDALKKTLRHYSLIPPGGGGILTHTVAHIASGIKVREKDLSGDGIESIIYIVESFLAQGKLAEAAAALEGGVSGSQAEEFVGEWVKKVRNRAITEQALSLLQSYATSISVT